MLLHLTGMITKQKSLDSLLQETSTLQQNKDLHIIQKPKKFGTWINRCSASGQAKAAPPPPPPPPPPQQQTSGQTASSGSSGKSKQEQLEDYEKEYLVRLEKEKADQAKAAATEAAAAAAAAAQTSKGTMPKGWTP